MIKIFITKEESSDNDEYVEHIGHIELLEDGNAISTVFGEAKLTRVRYRFINIIAHLEFIDNKTDTKVTLTKEGSDWVITNSIDSFRWKVDHKRLITNTELNKEISKWVINQVYSN
jgi:hypothetical protein